ncbi:MAG TPA: DUF4442 domain-containing protein [Cytophagales bacterium]|nr:DUF4442 domain-containing protein [Cytophagales bacterium]
MQVFKSSFKFKLFLISKLPLAWVAGLKIDEVNQTQAVVAVRYSYWTKNPFKSMYFAVQAMAAELASGALVLSHVSESGKNISMLVLKMRADFTKKALGRIRFICMDGESIRLAIQTAIATGEGQTIEATSIGYNENNEQVATFVITWTLKNKSMR